MPTAANSNMDADTAGQSGYVEGQEERVERTATKGYPCTPRMGARARVHRDPGTRGWRDPVAVRDE